MHKKHSNREGGGYSCDHLGSIIGIQDPKGKLTETYSYDEFGLLLTQPQVGRAVNFAYTDYPYEENGLYFAQARYYKAEIGRFINEDAYEGEIIRVLPALFN
ncbi:hypothetical protein M3650_04315 [Paenibacillus sp. MER TA 81-3]|uniref:RHS repeat domain-containing protein n=1 Tax=Paenibacillus sp. MER TA 81-3 TaxID=2939573 RepID=UPI00203E2479|nr:hypothetical protein [Paenibacillus sp. MER TA 81-3]MCM3337876.1 hypothetical protein [Paenibacillus sp. MER TA 81-3]